MRLGTRGSALALAQARIVAGRLGPDVELVVIRTAGDVSAAPIPSLGDGVFVDAIEAALRAGEIDIAVHSLKDLPTEPRPDLDIAAIPAREDPRDVLITRARGGLGSLVPGARVGTSSPRRAAFVRALRPDVTTRDIRGNVDTRLGKVVSGEYDATVLAFAGLRRLGAAVSEVEVLGATECPPAPGQGALAVQCRANDAATIGRLASLDDEAVRRCVTAERTLLRALGASCAIPLGALARIEGPDVVLDAALVIGDVVRRTTARAADPSEAARRAAGELGTYADA